jgi:hypothetical protein
LNINLKTEKTFAVAVLILALMLAVLSQTLSVNAQTESANVVIVPSLGGTTNPSPGTYTYDNGSIISLVATPDAGYAFHYWIISGNTTPGHEQGQNSIIVDPDTGDVIASIPRPAVPTGIDSLVFTGAALNVTCGYGYTFQYQAVFTPTNAVPSDVNATVVILPSDFGTTSPASGTYSFANGTSFLMTATPNSGYAFHYWVISGNFTPGHESATPTYIYDPDTGAVIDYFPNPPVATAIDSLVLTNPQLNVTCGSGYTFNYQAVFTPSSVVSPTPTIAPTIAPTTSPTVEPTVSASPTPETTDNTMWIIIAAVVVIIIVVIVAFMMLRKK